MTFWGRVVRSKSQRKMEIYANKRNKSLKMRSRAKASGERGEGCKEGTMRAEEGETRKEIEKKAKSKCQRHVRHA